VTKVINRANDSIIYHDRVRAREYYEQNPDASYHVDERRRAVAIRRQSARRRPAGSDPPMTHRSLTIHQ
jgi:hypothetical protein